MNEFQKQRDQIEDYRNQMSLKFRSLQEKIVNLKEESKNVDMDGAIVALFSKIADEGLKKVENMEFKMPHPYY